MNIELLLDKIKLSDLRKWASDLSSRYREGKRPCIVSEGHRLAYLVVRLPATMGAIEKALLEISYLPVTSLLDLGAGPGTGWMAAREVFPALEKGVCVEADAGFIALGKKLVGKEVAWVHQRLEKELEFSPHDLVLSSYAMGEVPEKFWDVLLKKAWQAARHAVAIIEPGTPAGFERIRKIREKLIALGGYALAPCPHAAACPMAGGDWCHFSARIPRSSFHRQIKEGTLGFEDEKFSYIIVGKAPAVPYQARILRRSVKQGKKISLTLCTLEGIKNKIIINDKETRKLEWGSKLKDNSL